MIEDINENLLNSNEAANQLGITKSRLSQLCFAGRLKFIKQQNRRFFTQKSVDDLIELRQAKGLFAPYPKIQLEEIEQTPAEKLRNWQKKLQSDKRAVKDNLYVVYLENEALNAEFEIDFLNELNHRLQKKIDEIKEVLNNNF